MFSSFAASLISTSITLPYNIILLKSTLLKNKDKINMNTIFKSGSLEYTRNIFGSTIFLYSYNYLRKDKYPIYIASIGSSFIVWGITYPIDNIKNHIIAKKKIIYNISYLYKGIKYPLIRSIPSSIVGFYVYEYLKELLI